MCRPLVSIIIPVFNSEQFISRCIESVIRQSLKNWELIVVDDGSTDSTYSKILSYSNIDSRIKVIHKENEGQGIARNLGIKYANGEFIGFMDSDDYIESNMLFEMTTVATKFSADLVYSYMQGEHYFSIDKCRESSFLELFDSKEKIDTFRRNMMGGLPEDSKDSWLGMSVCRSLFRNKIIKEHNIHFLSERIVNSEDLLFNIDYMSYCSKIVTIEREYYSYCHDNPNSFSMRPVKNRFNMFLALNDELKKRCQDKDEQLRIKRRFLANVRVAIVEKARWTTLNNYFEMRTDIFEILNNNYLRSILMSYPINKMPLKQFIYFELMLKKQTFLLIILAKIRYFKYFSKL